MSNLQTTPGPTCGCQLTPEEELAQLHLIAQLRDDVTRIERAPGRLTVAFTDLADTATLDQFVAGERQCCGHIFDIAVSRAGGGHEFRLVAPNGEHDMILATMAAAFDAHQAVPAALSFTEQSQTPRPPERSTSAGKIAGLGALFGIACLACLLPGLLAGGALAATFGALGADEVVFGALALALGIAAAAVALRRRSPSRGDDCGC